LNYQKYDHQKTKKSLTRMAVAKGAATPKRQFGTTRPFLGKSDGTGDLRGAQAQAQAMRRP
jgi:hypothetical protein